ncbi:MAG: response regulator transcription factor [Cyanobium sp.]
MARVSKQASVKASSTTPHPICVTAAERRVLKLILQGCSNGVIANHLMLSRRTVEGHVSALLQKTGCHSRTQLVLWALGEG